MEAAGIEPASQGTAALPSTCVAYWASGPYPVVRAGAASRRQTPVLVDREFSGSRPRHSLAASGFRDPELVTEA